MPRHKLQLAAVVVVASLAACTSGAGPHTSTTASQLSTTTTKPVDGERAFAEFRQCMSDNGVEVADVPLDGDGRPRLEVMSGQLDYSDPMTTEALSLCASILTDGALDLGYDEAYREAVVGQLAAFSRCLRARGVEGFPDPVAGFIGIGSPYPAAEIPYNDPDMPAAVIACEGTVFGESEIVDG